MPLSNTFLASDIGVPLPLRTKHMVENNMETIFIVRCVIDTSTRLINRGKYDAKVSA